jgi:serine phosphatase RsbU (regulator of sigma subunit)
VPEPQTHLDRLSEQVAALQENFKKLTRAQSPRDLAPTLAAAARELFPSSSVDLGFLAESGNWDAIVTSDAKALELLPKAPGHVRRSPRSLAIVQGVSGGPTVGLALSGATADFSDTDLLSLKILVHLFENACRELLARRNEKGLIFSLNHRILQLNSLIDTGIEVSALESHELPHRLALARAASLTNASKGVVRVSSGTRVVEQHTFPEGITPPADRSAGISSHFEFASHTYAFELFEKESRTGVIPFEETDQLLLNALARQVHASLENRYLHEQALERERIEQELNVAATIQQKIIPVSLPKIKGYDVAGKNIPSKEVGGDYYECIPLPNGTYCLVVGDVSGKGVPAALLVSSLHAYLSAYLESAMTLPELANKLNSALYRASTSDRFVTAFLGLLKPETGEMECVNAGHNPAYILRKDGNVQELKRGGLPLGIIDMGVPYESELITLEKGERFLVYSDGVTEAENEEHKFYEQFYPLQEFLQHHSDESAGEFITALIAHVRSFTKSAPQNDDITALFLARLM